MLRVSLLVVAVLAATGRPAAGQAPAPKKPPQVWLQSVERPNRGWDYDGKRILGHVGETVYLWDATTGERIDKWEGHKERIFAVRFSPDGTRALTSSWMNPGPISLKSKDTRTVLWDLRSGEKKAEFDGQVAGEFSPDGERVVTFTVRPGKLSAFNATVWGAATGREIAKTTLDEYADPYWDTLHFSPDGGTFAHVKKGAFLLYNGTEAVVYDAKGGGEIGRSEHRYSGGHRFTSAGALAWCGEKRAVVTDAKTGKELAGMPHTLGSNDSTWTHDGGKVAVLRGEKELTILDVRSGKVVSGDKLGPYTSGRAVVSPDNSRLAVEWGGANGLEPGLGLYDMGTGKELARVKLAEWGHLIGFAPDGKTLLVGGSEFVIYEAEGGKKVRGLKLLDKVEHDWNR